MPCTLAAELVNLEDSLRARTSRMLAGIVAAVGPDVWSRRRAPAPVHDGHVLRMRPEAE